MTQHGAVSDFDAFVRDQGERLRAIVASMAGRGPAEVDDLVQEGLARAYEKRATFVSEQHAVNFVCYVVRCLLVDEHRSWYRRNVVPSADVVVATTDDPAEVVVTRDESRRVVRSMAALPAAQRQLLWDHVVEGDSYAEIARRTATPLATVRSTAHRARLAVLHRVRDASDYVAGVSVFLRGRVTDVWWRLRPVVATNDGATACAVAVSLFFGGSVAAPALRDAVPDERLLPAHDVVAAPHFASEAPATSPRAAALRDVVEAPRVVAPAPTAPPEFSGPAFREVQFSGKYSQRCLFAPLPRTNPVSHEYAFDCTFTAVADSCLVVPQLTPFDCEVVVPRARMRAKMITYYDVLTGTTGCRPTSQNAKDRLASAGTVEYVDAPGAAPYRLPLYFADSWIATNIALVGRDRIGNDPVSISIEFPFRCEEVIDDRIGMTGSTRYGDATNIVDS